MVALSSATGQRLEGNLGWMRYGGARLVTKDVQFLPIGLHWGDHIMGSRFSRPSVDPDARIVIHAVMPRRQAFGDNKKEISFPRCLFDWLASRP